MNDLNNYLFEEIEKLQDEELTGEKLKTATSKAMTIAKLGEVIVKNASVQLNAAKFAAEYGENAPFTIGLEEKAPKKVGVKHAD